MTVWQIVDFILENSTGRKPEFYHCKITEHAAIKIFIHSNKKH